MSLSSSLSEPPALRGKIAIPGDKSITHRAIMLASLAEGESRILGYLPSEDCERTVAAFRAMGIPISPELDAGRPCLRIQGKGLEGLSEPEDVINCGNSGTTMRLLTGLLSAMPFFSVLTGDASLRSRPMGRVVRPLKEMGAQISGRSGGSRAPLAISGRLLSPIDYPLPIPSAQLKSAILLAGLKTPGITRLSEPSPSRDHTERMFKSFGLAFSKTGAALSIEGGRPFQGRRLEIPGDISSAAFFLVAGTLVPGSDITLLNVGLNPTRAGIIGILQEMGADITLSSQKLWGNEPVADLRVRAAPLHGIHLEGARVVQVLDEFPIFSIAAARAEGISTIRGAGELRVKESDRIEVMAKALQGMGVDLETYSDGIRIEGTRNWKGTRCETRGDHRVAMAMSVAGLLTKEQNTIDELECIKTSFPGFKNLLLSLQS